MPLVRLAHAFAKPLQSLSINLENSPLTDILEYGRIAVEGKRGQI